MSTAPVARVLIVDDEYYFRQLLIRLVDWEAAGFEVAAEADDGMAALQIIGEQPIDLIITDIEMPNMNGLDFIQEVRKLNSAAKLILSPATIISHMPSRPYRLERTITC